MIAPVGRTGGVRSFFIMLLFLSACAGRIVTGQRFDSPDNSMRLYISIITDPGVPYVERGRKHVGIFIHPIGVNNQKPISTYKYVAGYLDWEVVWRSPNEVEVELFEYPPGVSRHSDAAKTADRMLIAHLRFMRSAGETDFKEQH
ncbi:MAG: hypothetical protein U1F68_19365 [Gammaproteobacteria bacterium]